MHDILSCLNVVLAELFEKYINYMNFMILFARFKPCPSLFSYGFKMTVSCDACIGGIVVAWSDCVSSYIYGVP